MSHRTHLLNLFYGEVEIGGKTISDRQIHLCRLRYFDQDRWSIAFYTYSNEKYEPCTFGNGNWFGTPEEAFDIGAIHLE